MISISNITDLQKIGNDPGYPLDGDYELTQDLDATGVAFLPIGRRDPYDSGIETPFSGTFDGGGYTISNITIDPYDTDPTHYNLGLFGFVSGTISNLNISDIEIITEHAGAWPNSGQRDGGLVGRLETSGVVNNCTCQGTIRGNDVGGFVGANYGTITDCSFSGSIPDGDDVGGFVAYQYGTIRDCTVTSTTVHGSDAGGFAGNIYDGALIEDCSAEVTVSGSDVGGFVSDTFGGTCRRCTATSTLSGNDVGGFSERIQSGAINEDCSCSTTFVSVTGDGGGWTEFNSGIIRNCYCNGDVVGNDAGGFAEWNDSSGIIENCYCIGSVTGSDPGGFVSNNDGTISQCHCTGDVVATDDDAGGFVQDNDGTIDNCWCSGNVSGDKIVGGFANKNDGTIIRCSHSGTVSSEEYAYGFCNNNAGTIQDCSSTGDVASSGDGTFHGASGFCGTNEGTISNCSFEGDVSGKNAEGFCSTNQIWRGFGDEYHGLIKDCYAKGSVIAFGHYASGFVSTNEGDVARSYFSGSVSSDTYVDGFCGSNPGRIEDCYAQADVVCAGIPWGCSLPSASGFCSESYKYLEDYRDSPGGVIQNCYATGNLSGPDLYGFVEYIDEGGSDEGEITSCYWNTETSGVSTSTAGTGKTTEEMFKKSTFAGWDFTSTWYILEGKDYPNFNLVANEEVPNYRTISEFHKSSVGIDGIGYGLYLYHQLPFRVVAHKVAESGSNSGIYYIEGDVTSFISGYSYFWLEGKSLIDENIFQIDSATYDSDNLWTVVTITENSDYKSNAGDVGHYLCGRFDVAGSNRLKSLGDTISEMFEEGSLGSVAFDKFNFELNNEDRAFYDKVNRSGYFYEKDLITEVVSIQSESKFSVKSGLHTTFIRVKDLFEYDGSDFKFGWIEFITGSASGSKFPIISSNGYSFNILGYLAKSYEDLKKYKIDIKVGDKVRIFKSDVFWVKFDVWAREVLLDKFPVFSGKLDLGSVNTNDFERSIKVDAYSLSRDLSSHSLSDLSFDSGLNLNRLSELKALYLSANLKRIRPIKRFKHPDNPLQSISVVEVGYDVSEGWHIMDYYPGGLFRFDLGKWYHIVDEGSFEESTNSVFIASHEDDAINSYPAKLPDHSLNNVELEQIERKWHGGWARITVATEEAQFIGGTNRTLNNATNQYKKLSGLPIVPYRMLFKVNKDRTITNAASYVYSFDNGNLTVPNHMFDLAIWKDLQIGYQYDRTYDLLMGRKQNYSYTIQSSPATDYPWGYIIGSDESVLQLYSVNKFNGIKLLFRNEYYDDGTLKQCSGYGNLITRFLQHMSFHFSNGEGWKSNINLMYAGGYANANGTVSSLTLNLNQSISRDGGINGEYGTYQANMVGMRLLCISNSNFMKSREILTVSQNAGDSYGTLVDITTEAFSNSIDENDQFIVINKDYDIKFVDFGDSFKDGEHPDVLSVFRPRSYQAGTYYEDLKDPTDTDVVVSKYVKPLDKIYIGHRSKFDAVALSISDIVTTYDDHIDVSWFLKQTDMVVEYYNGLDWVPANNVILQPTTAVGVNDYNTTYKVETDDLVKYRIMFEARDWHVGGYDYTQYSSSLSQAPSAIDEDNMYMIRISLLPSIAVSVSNVSLSKLNELNLAVMWNEIEGWSKNIIEVENGKYFADTLTTSDVALDLYGIELQCRQSLTWLRQALPVTKLEGAAGDSLFVTTDYKQLDLDFDSDVVANDQNSENNITTIPRNINFRYLLERILKQTGFVNNKDFRLHHDTFSNPDENYLNIIGTKYDGMQPIDVGWDGAFYPQSLSEYVSDTDPLNNSEHHSSCVLRDNGRFYLVAARQASDMIDVFTSIDMKTWSLENSFDISGQYQILNVKVVKNRDDENYVWYVTGSNASGRYSVSVGNTTDMSSSPTLTEIISDVSYNFGQVDVLHVKGNSSDTSDCYRLLCVIRYNGLNVDGDDYPTDDPYLHFYLNGGDISNPSDWVQQFELNGALGTDPVFLKGNFVDNDGNTGDNKHLNQFTMIFKGTNDKLYKTAPRLNDEWSNNWDYPNAIVEDTFSISGLSAVVDGYIYYHMLDDSREAYTLVPTFRNSFLLYGLDANHNFDIIAINDTIDDVDENQIWMNKIQEMNEIDWFKSEYENIVISNSSSTNGLHKRMYLGLRKPFGKILPRFRSISYGNRVLMRYWNGVSWQEFDNIYQNGRSVSNSKVNPIFGFYFPRPSDWVSDTFENIISVFDYTGLNQKSPSLYWVEVSLPSGYSSDKEIEVKGFRNCYTNVFLWKGRSLYVMENWKYIKQIFTVPGDSDQRIKIDGISYDKTYKNIILNTADDNPYGYNESDSFLFDVFGVAKNSYPLDRIGYSGSDSTYNEYNMISQVRPSNLVRAGKENEYTVGGSSKYAFLFGGWDEDFLKEIYGASAINSGYSFAGYNIPVPFEQIITKHWKRGTDWNPAADDIINNLWLARRFGINEAPSYSIASIYQYSNSYAYMVGALTQSGLLNEELINKPVFNITAGYYAALEKNIKTKYEWLSSDIQDILVGSYPGAPTDGQVWLIKGDEDSLHSDFSNDNNSLIQYHSDTTDYTFIRPYRGQVIKDLSDSDQLYVWNGYKWDSISDTDIWSGRSFSTLDAWVWLEWDVGSEGVRQFYFRDYDVRPSVFLNNNTNKNYDKKFLRAYRDIPSGDIYEDDPFGGPDVSYLPDNMKATCSVSVPDLASIKYSDGPISVTEDDGYTTRTVKVIDPASPASVFGLYAMEDATQNDASTVRDDTAQVNPYAFSGIAAHKPYGKVKNWLKCLYYNGSTYSDVTDEMNYKTLGNSWDLSGTKYMYVCSPTRFFAMTLANTASTIWGISRLEVDGTTWTSQNALNDLLAVFGNLNIYEHWAYKTHGSMYTWNPFEKDWGKTTFQGTEGYWLRITKSIGSGNLQWAVLSGYMLWDNMRWWEDYDIESDKAPTSPSDVEKRFFDTYIPMSVEYDIINKKVIGSFWNFDPNVNEYYPFRIPFDREQLFNDSGEYFWSWDNQETIDIIDSNKYNYARNIKSIATISHIDSKALLVDDASYDKAPVLANIKSLKTGDKLFSFGVSS